MGRLIQGAGSGGIPVACYTAISNISNPQDRMKKLALISSIWGIAAITGPIFGSLVSYFFMWKIFFIINIPFAILCIVIFTLTPIQIPLLNKKPVDLLSSISFLLLLAFVLIFINSISIKSSLITNLVLLLMIIFLAIITKVFLKRKKTVFILSSQIIHNKKIRNIFILNFIYSSIFYSSVIIVSLLGSTTFTNINHSLFSCLVVSLGSLGWVGGSIKAKKISACKKISKIYITTSLILSLSVLILFTTTISSNIYYKNIFSILSVIQIGISMGVMATVSLVNAQIESDKSEVGTITSNIQLIRSLGAAIGIGFFTSLEFFIKNNFNNNLLSFFVTFLTMFFITIILIISQIIEEKININKRTKLNT